MVANMLRTKLGMKDEEEVAAWKDYILITSKQDNVSEHGFYTLIAWPDSPVEKGIEDVLNELKLKIPIAIFNGDSDWMCLNPSKRLAKTFSNVSLHIVEKSGHYITTDNPRGASDIIIEIVKRHR